MLKTFDFVLALAAALIAVGVLVMAGVIDAHDLTTAAVDFVTWLANSAISALEKLFD